MRKMLATPTPTLIPPKRLVKLLLSIGLKDIMEWNGDLMAKMNLHNWSLIMCYYE